MGDLTVKEKLRLRVLTAMVLAPLVIWGTLSLPGAWFAAVVGLIVLGGGWEWSRLAGLAGAARVGYLGAMVLMMAAIHPLLSVRGSVVAVGAVGLVWWLLALASVIRYPNGTGFWRSRIAARLLAGLFILLPAWACLVLLQREVGPVSVVLLLFLIWAADTGAYFAGRRWGRHKLAPRVSPGKTWEGAAGGAVLALCVAAVGGPALVLPVSISLFLLMCLVVFGFSVLGDLVESMFKRMTAVKDSGGLLPGHGGILDRIDSLTAAAPVFALGLHLLGRAA